MSKRLEAGLMLLGLAATPATADANHRYITIVAEAADPRAGEQNAALQRDAAALRDRDVIVQNITPEAARSQRPELAVGSKTAFEVLLIGKDGGVKLRREAPVSSREITALIDTMPMRQEEMRRRK